jgi:hypothetical protein
VLPSLLPLDRLFPKRAIRRSFKHLILLVPPDGLEPPTY